MEQTLEAEAIYANDYRNLFPEITADRWLFAIPDAVKKVLHQRPAMRVSKWAERHRVVSMSSLPGPWRNEVTPYIAGIMDAVGFPSVEDINICKAPQTGGSEGVNTFVGYIADRAPGPVLYVFPDQITAKENSQDRIQTMFRDSPRLSAYLTGAEDDMASFRINLVHMPIYLAWANSASRLGNKPIQYLVFDETDKYPEMANKREAGPIALGEKRTITYEGQRKRFKISTPTIEAGVIWVALTKDSEVVFDYLVRCPFCNEEQLMVFDQIKWPEDERDPRVIKSKSLARYECPHCQALWTDVDRDRAVRAGVWRARVDDWKPDEPRHALTVMRHLIKYRPKSIGFHIPSWVSRFVSLSEVAAAFLKGQKNRGALRDFMNAHKAEPWKDYTAERQEDVILALRDDRPRGLVPGDTENRIVAGLTGAIDTQDRGFYYEIRAWGYAHVDPQTKERRQESWQIREGFALTFADLERILWSDTYQDIDDNKYHVDFAGIDAMGHRAKSVYHWVRGHRGRIIAIQGVQKQREPLRFSRVSYYPKSKIPIPGGVPMVHIWVTHYKNYLSNVLDISPADPGAWHMHSEMTEEWASQMCAEYTDEKGFWQCPSGRRNEAWDLSVYSLAIVELRGIGIARPDDNPPSPPKTPPARIARKEERSQHQERFQRLLQNRRSVR